MNLLDYKVYRFIMWAMVIWGVGEIVKNVMEEDYANAIIDVVLGLWFIWMLSKDREGN